MWFGELWGEDDAKHAALQHQHQHHRAAAAAAGSQIRGRTQEKRPTPKTQQRRLVSSVHNLNFSFFLVPRACVHWECVGGERH